MNSLKNKRIVFFGTPEFSVPALRALADSATVVAVVTQPDKPAGRSKELVAPPVAGAARERGISVLQPDRLRGNAQMTRTIMDLHPDYLVVIAYGKIIPAEILAAAPALNVHPSLLPDLRGPSPISSAVLRGDAETGITIMLLDAEMDHGPILSQERVGILPDEYAEDLEGRLAVQSAQLLLETLDAYAAGDLVPREQDHAAATYCHLFTKEDGRIAWSSPVSVIHNTVRALTPWPSAHTTWAGKQIKILRSAMRHDTVDHDAHPLGSILLLPDGALAVACLDGYLIVHELQQEGKRPMTAPDFLRGNPSIIGATLGT